MSEKIKNYLGVTLIIASLAFAYAAVGFVVTRPDYSERTFSVTGEGEAVGIPDVGKFTFSVLTEGGLDLSVTQSDNSERTNKVTAYLKQNGVGDEDIKTENYSVYPRYQYYSCREGGICPPEQIVGYSVNHTLSVEIRNLENAGGLLSGVIQNGANSVSQLTFEVDDPTTVKAEARMKAVEDAKAKAKALAEAGGFRVGKLVSISVEDAQPYYGESYYDGFGKGGDTFVTPELEPGSQKINITAWLTYEIK